MPQLALGLPELIWTDTGESTFQVSASIGGRAEAVTFTLDGHDQVIRASSSRPYDVPGGFEEAPWRYEFAGHRGFGNTHMPEEAVWRPTPTATVIGPLALQGREFRLGRTSSMSVSGFLTLFLSSHSEVSTPMGYPYT
jgi:hypothetical protein